MTKALDRYWTTNREWWHFEGFKQVLNEDAPPEAKESYRRHQEQIKKYTEGKDRIL